MTITDKEFVRILKYCNTIKTEQHCNTCPFYEYEKCTTVLLDGAADLIKYKDAEIERLQKYNTEVAFKHYNDGVKEFAEKVKEETYHYYDSDIDELAKEMRAQKNDD